MLRGATLSARETVGTAVFRMVVSSDSMKSATATSHGSNFCAAALGAASGEVIVFGFANGEKANEGQDSGACQIVANILQAVVFRQPGGDVRRERGSQDSGKAKGQRATGVSYRSGKELGDYRAERAIGESHERQTDGHHQHGSRLAGDKHGRHDEAEDADERGDPEHHAAAATLRQNRGYRNGEREERNIEQLHEQKCPPGIAERDGAPGEREDGHQIEENERRETNEDTRHQRFGVFAKDIHHGSFGLLAAVERLTEDRRFRDGKAHIESKEHEHGAGQEWQTPAERKELLVIGYALHALRTEFPLLQMKLFGIRTFRASVSGSFFTRLGLGGVPFLLPLLYQVGLGYTPVQSGLLIMPQALASMSTKFLIPKILSRLGYRGVLVSNMVILGFMLMLFATIGIGTPVWVIVLQAFCYGALTSLQYTSMNTLVYADITEEETSSASSIASTAQQLAVSFGVAAAGLTTAVFVPDRFRSNAAEMIHGTHLALLALGGLTIFSTLVFRSLKSTDGGNVSQHRDLSHTHA